MPQQPSAASAQPATPPVPATTRTTDRRRNLKFPRNPSLRVAAALTVIAALITPGLTRIGEFQQGSPLLGVLLFGTGIVAAAFALSWAGETAELDISGGLALGLLAIIAILPEYAIDLYFAYRSGAEPALAAYAAANMTGSNRLLLGFGWPLVFGVTGVAVWFARRRGARLNNGVDARPLQIRLPADSRVELGLLLIASVPTGFILLTQRIHVVWGVALLALFGWYLFRVSREEGEEPVLLGVAGEMAKLSTRARRSVVVGVFVAASAAILALARPFAESLVAGGQALGFDDFLLVQWLAPLASESPEFVIALVFAARGRAAMALGMLLASKVNQWTALVGSLPVAHALGGGSLALPVDERQLAEIALTAGQTLFGVAVLLTLRFTLPAALVLLASFVAAFFATDPQARWWFAAAYLAAAVVLFWVRRAELPRVLRAPFALTSQPHSDPA